LQLPAGRKQSGCRSRSVLAELLEGRSGIQPSEGRRKREQGRQHGLGHQGGQKAVRCRGRLAATMTARELYQAGKLAEAVQALNTELRENPGDVKRRTFLFELLCFAGNYDRADKQLEILAQENKDAQMGALVYRAALHAERTRCDVFQKKEYPQTGGSSEPQAVKGTWNGKPFESISDADPRIGARLEVFAAGQYLWVPFEHIASIEIQPPKRLRDLIWAPAILRTGPSFRDRELGEVLLPVLAPFSF